MKKKLEKEITFYSYNSNDPVVFIEGFLNSIGYNELAKIDYKDTIEIRYEDNKNDKSKIIFKINHGIIYYQLNIKNRISNIYDDIQIYDEWITEWKELEEDVIKILNKKIISFYYKEKYKFKFKENKEKFKILYQILFFFDNNMNIRKRCNYIELEGQEIENIKKEYMNYCHENNLKQLNIANSKVTLGSSVLDNTSIYLGGNINEINKKLTDIFLEMSTHNIL